MSAKGFTVLEVLVAMAVGSVVIMIAVPALNEVVRRARHGAAVRRVLDDVREARSRAIRTGWEYRLVGYDSDETGARRNQYRILARQSTAVAWPGEEDAPFESSTQLALSWIDVASEYPGIDFDSTSARFQLTFDPRGTAPDASTSFNPLHVRGPDGLDVSLTVSVVGGARVE